MALFAQRAYMKDAATSARSGLKTDRKLVEANLALIARMEAKIKAKLAEVWGE